MPSRSSSSDSRRSAAAADSVETNTDADVFLEQRVRRETRDFAFDSLLNGVSTKGDSSSSTASGGTAAVAARPSILPGAPQDTAAAGTATSAAAAAAAATRLLLPVSARLALGVAAVLLGGCLALPGRGGAAHSSDSKGQPVSAVAAAAALPALASTAAPDGARKPGQPDPALTPGHRQEAARAEGAISPDVRAQVLRSYKIDPADKKHVLARLIPAPLGGTEEPANLFPVTPWFLDLKTRLDKQLAEKVGRGELTVAQAVSELRTDWIAAAHRHEVRNYGHADREAARQTESKLNW